MKKLIDGVMYDASFVKSHTLRPGWFKAFKIFIFLGFLAVYSAIFGWRKMLAFLVAFLLLSMVVHMTYRLKTNRFTQSWLDFVVVQEGSERRYQRIGKFYYAVVIVNVMISVAVSQLVVP